MRLTWRGPAGWRVNRDVPGWFLAAREAQRAECREPPAAATPSGTNVVP